MESDTFLPHKAKAVSWDGLSRIFMYAIALLLPIWVLPLTIFPVELNKAFLFYILVLLAFISWIAGRIQEGEIHIPKNFIAGALLAVLVVSVLSGLFSVSFHMSFLGLGHESGTVGAFLLFILAAFLMSFLFTEEKEARIFLTVIGISSLAVFLLQMGHIFGGLWNNFFTTPAANTIGTWNGFGIYWGFIGFVSLFIAKQTSGRFYKALFYALTAAAVISLVAVNFRTAWVLFAVCNVILFTYFYSFKRHKKGMHWEPVLFLLIALLFITTPVLGQTISNVFGATTVEVRPSWGTSWTVIRETLTERNLFLGSGPNTFLYDWLLYKPSEINTTPFWATRFNTGISSFVTLLGTLGLLGGLALLFLIGSIFFYGVRAVLRYASREESGFFAVLSFLAVIYLLIVAIFYTPSFLLTAFFFLFIGLFIAQAKKEGVITDYKVRMFQNAGMGFVSALALLFFSVVSIGGIYILGQKYAGAIYYGKGLRALAQTSDLDTSRGYLAQAMSLDASDRYARSLVDLDLLRLRQLLTRTDLSVDEVRAQFQTILAQAIQTGQFATRVNPIDPLNWFSLGKIYEAVIPFNVEGAIDFADTMYTQAFQRSPRSPEALLARARVLSQKRNFDEAKILLRSANEIKSDYAPARFLLAQLEAQSGNLKEAITESRNAQFLVPNDSGVLFQLGLLYYQDGQFDNARQVFLRAIELNENYSNARYFLGLIYDRQGENENAIAEFARIQELNPSNGEVEQILLNLREGRSALTGIASPAPEDRPSPPVEDSNESE